MNITRYNATNRQAAEQDFFGAMFNDFFAPFTFIQQGNSHTQSAPRVDIYEKENRIFIHAELPGVPKEEISVDIKGKQLTLSGERKTDQTAEQGTVYRKECRYGAFERTFTLPFIIKSENIDAAFDNGVLKLAITRPEEETTTRIAIN